VRKIGIDTRGLAHPAPLEMAIKVLQQLDTDTYLHMLHTKNPIPLLDLAEEQGFRTISQKNSAQDWEIVITNNQHTILKDLLSV